MSLEREPPFLIEPERYELITPAPYHFGIDRRGFFKLLGSGIFIVTGFSNNVTAQESGAARRYSEDSLPQEISAWLHINEDAGVTAFTGKVEVGQNIRTSLTQAIAEELAVEIGSVQIVMGDTQLVPFDLGTFGSRTTPIMNLQLRRVSAAAREILIGLAARQWNVDRSHLTVHNGKVLDARENRTLAYAQIVKGQQISQVLPVEEPLIPAADWKFAGQSTSKIEGRDFVTGKHRYPYDQALPGMLYGKVVRPTAFEATLVSADTRVAEGLPGVTVIRDGNFLAVAAPTTLLATKAALSIRTEWKSDPQTSRKNLFEYLKQNQLPREERNDGSSFESGNIRTTFSASAHRLQQTYTVSYIAHAPLEPRAALAQWKGDQLTVWTGTQRPFGVRSELASAFHIPEEKVRVLMPDTGSAYGGKHTGEAAIEAARLARAAKQPVKVCWTREEEFTWGYFRPAGIMDINSVTDAEGKLAAWEYHNYNSGTAGIRTYYEVPNQKIEYHPAKTPLRQGSYRGLAATANHFAREVHMDEIAQSVKMDPLQFRLKNLKEERLRSIFELGAAKFGWGNHKAPNHGFGTGGGYEKLGYVATFVELVVHPDSKDVNILRVLTAFDCGAVVNPDGLRNQIVGANIMGLGGALFEQIDFDNGQILNNHFVEYRVPRFRDVPVIETLLIDRKDHPSVGAGEAPIVGLAPAISNAIFDASGIRLRALPMIPNGIVRSQSESDKNG